MKARAAPYSKGGGGKEKGRWKRWQGRTDKSRLCLGKGLNTNGNRNPKRRGETMKKRERRDVEGAAIRYQRKVGRKGRKAKRGGMK